MRCARQVGRLKPSPTEAGQLSGGGNKLVEKRRCSASNTCLLMLSDVHRATGRGKC
ncbi:MAG: hypothetical protein JWP20_1610 [Roseomonas sp.]|nr:hypothetical protein [Roseomonas sp.]